MKEAIIWPSDIFIEKLYLLVDGIFSNGKKPNKNLKSKSYQ